MTTTIRRCRGRDVGDASIRSAAIAAAKARIALASRPRELSIDEAKGILTGPSDLALASVWRRGELASEMEIEVQNHEVTLHYGGLVRTFSDNAVRIDCSGGAAFCASGADLPVQPALLLGLVDEWPAMRRDWSVEGLKSRFDTASVFEVDGGPSVARQSLASAAVSMSVYAAYCEADGDSDDAPLYIFDAKQLQRTFADGSKVSEDLSPTPVGFQEDIMANLLDDDERRRPLPPAWLLVGTARSGTPIHDHPLTAAWNVLLHGAKLWVALPPNVDRSALHLNPDEDDGFDLAANEWFLKWIGRTRGDQPLPSGAVVILQKPSETVFLPAGWWHVVLNVQDSVAISRSLALKRDFIFQDSGPRNDLERQRAVALDQARLDHRTCTS